MEGRTRVVGLCQTMCPVDEFQMREREGLLHQLELPPGHGQGRGRGLGRGRGRRRGKCRPVGDLDYAVKEYTRPAAGRADPDPRVLRPPSVLHKTINFLFNTHTGRQHSSADWKKVYEFVFDRLRAVRQDMVIQEMSGQDAITVLEACVSFHVYAAYRLCEEGLETFDPVINHQHTQECLKRLIYLYSQTPTDTQTCTDTQTNMQPLMCSQTEGTHQQSCRRCPGNTDSRPDRAEGQMDDADSEVRSQTHRCNSRETTADSSPNAGQERAECVNAQENVEARLKGLSVSDSPSTSHTAASEDMRRLHPHRAEFESVYLLYNLGDSHAISHFLQLPKHVRSQRLPALAYEMSISCMLGNTLRVVRRAASLPSPLALCAFHRHLAAVQRQGLQILCAGFSSKATRFPLTKLGQLLAHDSESQTEAACTESGLQVHDGTVSLLKSEYQRPERVKPRVWEYLEGKLSTENLPNMLLGWR